MTKKQELIKVNMNLPVRLVEKVRTYAESLGLNLTSAYIVLLSKALEQKDMMDNLPQMLSAIVAMKEFEKVQNFQENLEKKD